MILVFEFIDQLWMFVCLILC